MSIKGGIVSAPAGLAEVADMLGCGTDIGQCCTSKNINKWSKDKPYLYASLPPLTDTQKHQIGYGLQVSGKGQLESSNAGFFFSEILNDYKTWATTEWQYNKPVGGVASPFRLLDFENYNHYAKFPCRFLSTFVRDGSPIEAWIDFSQNQYDIHVGDIFNEVSGAVVRTNVYLCIIALKGTSNRLIITSPSPISRSTEVLQLLMDLPEYGNWNIAVGLCDICVPEITDIASLGSDTVSHAQFFPLLLDDPTQCAYTNAYEQSKANFIISPFGFSSLRNWQVSNGLKGTVNNNGFLVQDILFNTGAYFYYNYQLIFGIKVETKTSGNWALVLPDTVTIDNTFAGDSGIQVIGTWTQVSSGVTGSALTSLGDATNKNVTVTGGTPSYFVFRSQTATMFTAFPLALNMNYQDISDTNPTRGQTVVVKVDLGTSLGQLLNPVYLQLSN